MLRKKSNIKGQEEVCRSVELYVKAVDEIVVQKCENVRKFSEGPPLYRSSRHKVYMTELLISARENCFERQGTFQPDDGAENVG